MVLSKKKLKQKLRTEFDQISESKRPDFDNQKNPQTAKSQKQLLDSNTQKPRKSKREKHREKITSLQINGETSDTHVVETSMEEKKNKRKREETLKVEEINFEEIQRRERKRIKNEKRKLRLKDENGVRVRVKKESDVSKEGKIPPSKSKKIKKKKKKKTKAKIDDEEKQIGAENGVLSQQSVDDTSQENDDENNKKVYVGGMPYSSTEDDIWNYFDHCGAITDIDCMKFPETGKFRGIAIISFKTQEAAKKALELDGSDMGGLYLKIQPFKTTRTTKSSDFSTPVIEGYNRIYAGNLSWDITEDDLRKFFSNCNISSIRFGEDKETGEFKGYAHVDFADDASLTKALKLDQKVVCGRPVKISRAVPMKGAQKSLGTIPSDSPVVKPEENNDVVPGKIRRRTCYECGEKGHLSSACPKKQANDQTNSNPS